MESSRAHGEEQYLELIWKGFSIAFLIYFNNFENRNIDYRNPDLRSPGGHGS